MSTLQDSGTGPQPTPFLRADEFDGDEQDWYLMERAVEIGIDPREAVSDVRAAIKRRARLLPSRGTEAPPPKQLPLEDGGLPWPPGFAGAIAAYVYGQAHRSVREVAIVGALGLLAGVCGRAWCIPGSGLNIYIVLVARSGIGKEAMHSGISGLIAAARERYNRAGEFACYDDFASGPALTKYLLGAPCSVNVAGELGHKFSAMAKDTESAMRSLRRTLTNLYSKSGRGNVAGGIAYSNQENNAASIEGVAYSLIGETTPGTFFESITRGMMEDGFMSRFTVIEYVGDRPDKNADRCGIPDDKLVAHLVTIMQHAHTLSAQDKFQDVQFSAPARAVLDEFEVHCDDSIRATPDDEAVRQLWNRAALKVLRVSALLAVGDNHLFPNVTLTHASWAIELVRRDIAVFSKRIQSGDVGDGSDDARERKLLSFLHDYLVKPVPGSYKVKPKMHADGIVPRSYLQIRSATLPAFANHKFGSSRALDDAIRTLIANGKLMEVKQDKVAENYSFQGKAYRILDL